MEGAGKGRILVVDDEPSVLVTYRMILERQGYKVSAALTSEEARRFLEQDNIELLLCDLSLEKQQSGFDVIAYANRVSPGLPSVLLTGYATQEANDRADELGIPVLFKPIDIQQLLQTISELLRTKDEQQQQHKAGD